MYRVVLCRQRATLDPTGGTGGRETARMRDRVDFPKRKSIIPYTKVPKTRNSEIRAETRRRSMGRGARAQKTTPSIVLCICTGPTLSTENLSPCARESSSLPNPPTPSNSPDRTAPPSASPLAAIASLLLVFRPSPSVRLRPPPPLAPRRAARPVLKRAAVHHGRGPRAPCPHVEADLSRAGLWASWAAASRGSCASRSRRARRAAPPT